MYDKNSRTLTVYRSNDLDSMLQVNSEKERIIKYKTKTEKKKKQEAEAEAEEEKVLCVVYQEMSINSAMCAVRAQHLESAQ